MTDGTIHINFSDDEKQSEGRLYEAVPTGEYRCRIVKIEAKKVKDEKPDGTPNPNKGKGWWNVQLICTEGKYEKRTFFASVMLFTDKDKPSAFLLAQLLKSTGHGDALASGNVPAAPTYIGKELIALVQRKRDTYNKTPGEPSEHVNQVTGFKPLSGATAKGSSNLLPG